MLKRQLKAFAAGLGFVRAHISTLPEDFHWRANAEKANHLALTNLTDDVQSIFPGECRAVLLVYPYLPYDDAADGATVSAYYPASDEANRKSVQVEAWLQERGYRALCRPNIPYKPIAAHSGMARYGRNGVTAIEGFGSRYALQIVLTDAPMEPDPGEGNPFLLSDSCANCGRCVQACPVGALDGTGQVDISRCIRAKSDEYPLADEYRTLIGRSLYGCDICQDVCPRNAGIGRQPVPEDFQGALRLERLLAGEVSELVPYIGKNYARKARMQAKACVIAANMGRRDLLEAIALCKDSPVDFVKDHAEWAEKKLK